jgi:polyphosphate kinase
MSPKSEMLARSEVPLINRELSWLEFNRRVLAEGENPSVPILERLKFISIASSNLDEFFTIRLSGVRDIIAAGLNERSADGMTAKQQLKAIRERARRLLDQMYAALSNEILPELRKNGIVIGQMGDFSPEEQEWFRSEFTRQIAPILTPLAFDPGHPFPFLSNLTLNLAIMLESARGDEHIAFIRVPTLIPRLIRLPGTTRFLPLEALIGDQLGTFFPGLQVRTVTPFRVIRNADLSLREEDVQDLLKSVESELRRRDRQAVVWLEIAGSASERLIDLLTSATRITHDDISRSPGLLKLDDLMQVYAEVPAPKLKEPQFNPRIPAELVSTDDIFSIIRRGDILLHRPYDSFSAVVELVQAASQDPDVVAIKQTLYRTDEGSKIIDALAAAALSGKQVTAIVELQARGDEMKNITWARRLENAGVQVVYGLVGIKTHCKVCLVVRREGGTLRRYLHLSTGNYNAATAKLYTDIDLFTCNASFGEDAAQVVNLLTGFSIASVQEIFERHVTELRWNHFIVAPIDYHRWVIEMIEREIEHASNGRQGRITAKFNALVDPAIIETLYRASRAGVRIDLNVRGICCLVPGIAGTSENIRITSVVDRYLEHSRIFHFANGGDDEVFVSSGDWMPRNFLRRIEITYPVLDPALRQRLIDEVLAIALADNVKAWELQGDGSYVRLRPDGAPLRSQERFIEITRAKSARLGPYEESLTRPASYRKKAKKPRKKK